MEVVVYPDPALRRGGRKVEAFDASLARLADEMFVAMYAQRGVGLAAPQVAIEQALLVLNPTGDRDDADQALAMVNPEVVSKKGKEWGEEGCLSFPGIYAEVERAQAIVVGYQDLAGAQKELRADGFLARVIQHEMDHIGGVLFVDRLSSVEKLRVKPLLAEMERRYKAGA
jgi:peptide deformylase